MITVAAKEKGRFAFRIDNGESSIPAIGASEIGNLIVVKVLHAIV